MRKRDFLSLWDVTAGELTQLLARAAALKAARVAGQATRSLPGRILGMIFEKPSTRTRVSFEVGMVELGGHAVYLAPEGTQIGRGEPLPDTARVLGGYCHGIVIRTFAQARADELARWAPIPVLNGLTDLQHPCQVVADLFTVLELRGAVAGLRYAWLGDGNNMAHSWIDAAAILGLDLVCACPEGYDPSPAVVARARAHMAETGAGSLSLVRDPAEAAAGADVLSTDVWASMGQEAEAAARRRAFAGFCLDDRLLGLAAGHSSKTPVVLHCLPAHRGEEISESVLEGPASAVWRQAENRLHTQKAVLELFLGRYVMNSVARVEALLQELGIQERVTRVADNVWSLMKGSATVQIVAAREFVVATATVAEGAPAKDPEGFYRMLLAANTGLLGAFFTLEANGSIRLNQVLPVDWLQGEELGFILGNVAARADEWDDKLRAFLG